LPFSHPISLQKQAYVCYTIRGAVETNLSDQIQTSSTELLDLIGTFDEKAISTIPYAGSWTAAQVADHVLKSYQLILSAVQGKAEKTDRDPEMHVAQIKKLFLDFTLKFQSPEMIRPADVPAAKAELLTKLTAAIRGVKEASETIDLSFMCIDIDMPGLGKLTRIEWLSFFVAHTQRHLHQLKNIAEALIGK
jgi:hypothetical protein